MTVQEIIENYLKENGFKGLVDGFLDCGCNLVDLFPCGDGCALLCEPAYRVECNCEDHNGHHYQKEKPVEEK